MLLTDALSLRECGPSLQGGDGGAETEDGLVLGALGLGVAVGAAFVWLALRWRG